MSKTSEFATSTFRKGKKTLKQHGLSSLIAIVISTAIPLIQEWHADKVRSSGDAMLISTIQHNIESEINKLRADTDEVQRDVDAETAKVKADILGVISDMKREQSEKDNAQWQVIATKKDKTP